MKIFIFTLLFSFLYCLGNQNDLTTFGKYFTKMKDLDSLSELENQCLLKNNTKNKPTPEPNLHRQCKPYRAKSCCKSSTSQEIHRIYSYEIFNSSTCQQNIFLSDSCRKHFESQLCFHECSPNIGPWILKNFPDRFIDVPLCKSDCDAWFEACKNDNGCFLGWNFGYADTHLWSDCTKNNCLTFKDVYSNAEEMCEKVWDRSWKVIDGNGKGCMTVFYNPENNPNAVVMRRKIYDLAHGISAGEVSTGILFMTGFFLIFFAGVISLSYTYAVRKKGVIIESGEEEVPLHAMSMTTGTTEYGDDTSSV